MDSEVPRTWRWLTGLVLSGLLACNSQPTSEPKPAVSSAPVGSSPAPLASLTSTASALPESPSYPADLDVNRLLKQLHCTERDTKHACAVCNEFGKAERFTGKTPSGEGRWFGRATVIENGKERREYRLLLARTLPTARVGKFSLPLGISIAPVPPDLEMEAGRLWTRMSGSRHRGNRKNLVFKQLEALEPKGEQGAINTLGMSVQLIAEPTADIGYLRQPSLKKLLLVMPARGLNAAPGDGTYAEFWQAVW
jgi:hypothetical protein